MPDTIVIFSTDWLNSTLVGARHSSNTAAECQTQLTCIWKKPGKAAPPPNYSQRRAVQRAHRNFWAGRGSGSSATTDPWIGSCPFPPHQHTVIFCLPNPRPTPIQIYLYSPFLFLGSDVSPYGVLTGTKCYCEGPAFASSLGCWQQGDKSSEYPKGP